ncbi:hypothetical protein [Rhodococcus rhodochrous]|uniref:hypothetical protein n=1 Tax=Rhodococcus rhodochrous TaxID=1829 RepID=UPI0023F68769
MSLTEYTTNEVFGVSRDIPLNYAERVADEELVESLSRNHHIVIYGSSKQGKTSLRKFNLREDEYTVVSCSNKWTLAQLMESILKQVGYTLEESYKQTSSEQGKISIAAKISAKFFGNGGEVSASTDYTAADSNETVYRSLELDPNDVNDVIKALETIGFNQWLVLEDFHYLPEQTQKDFAVALKAFHEMSSYTFIVVGVWLQEDRLLQYNGDLIGRVTTINADKWTRGELEDAIRKGEDLLNVRFSQDFREELFERCFDSIYVVQEACRSALLQNGITRTCAITTEVNANATSIVKEVVNKQSGRYLQFLTNFSRGFNETTLAMYKWLLVPIVMTEIETLEQGITYREIRRIIDRIHPNSPVNAGNVSQALTSITKLQIDTGMKPVVFDYDQSLRRLTIVDRSFSIWLAYQDKTDLLDHLELPSEIASNWPEISAAT